MNQLQNKVQLIGHAGINPEIKKTTNGTKMAKLALATHEVYKDKNGDRKTETQWHNLVLWGRNANSAENYIRKGSRIAIEGKISNRSYVTPAGEKKFISQIIVNEIVLMGHAA